MLRYIECFDVGEFRIWKYQVITEGKPRKRNEYCYRLGRRIKGGGLRFEIAGGEDFKTKKAALAKIEELCRKYVICFVPKKGKSVLIKCFPTRGEAETAVGLLYQASLAEGASRYYRVNYSTSPECPHYPDNQGLCHSCGITLDEGTAKESGYYQEEP